MRASYALPAAQAGTHIESMDTFITTHIYCPGCLGKGGPDILYPATRLLSPMSVHGFLYAAFLLLPVLHGRSAGF